MKLQHHVPIWTYKSDPITPEYQAQVDRDTSKAMVAYERAQQRLAAAELRRLRADERVQAATGKKRHGHLIREAHIAAELVELRREELQRIEDLMRGIPASVEHRGRKAFRPVPQPGRQV